MLIRMEGMRRVASWGERPSGERPRSRGGGIMYVGKKACWGVMGHEVWVANVSLRDLHTNSDWLVTAAVVLC